MYKYKLGNFTIILPSYNCDKSCPFCIAKNNKKFNSTNSEDFLILSKILENLKNEGIKFERIVLSGNGEPSLYSLDVLKQYAEIIKKNEDMFDGLRIHTSGNIFWEIKKFELFNNLVPNVEFDLLRAAVEPSRDMQILGYKRDYTKSDSFRRAKKIKLDLALTKILESSTCAEKLEELINENPNIVLVRFKNLMIGENDNSSQAEWVQSNRMTKSEFINFANTFLNYCEATSMNNVVLNNGTRVLFENSGNYPKDVVYSNCQILDYDEQPVTIHRMKEMSGSIDITKPLVYYEIER